MFVFIENRAIPSAVDDAICTLSNLLKDGEPEGTGGSSVQRKHQEWPCRHLIPAQFSCAPRGAHGASGARTPRCRKMWPAIKSGFGVIDSTPCRPTESKKNIRISTNIYEKFLRYLNNLRIKVFSRESCSMTPSCIHFRPETLDCYGAEMVWQSCYNVIATHLQCIPVLYPARSAERMQANWFLVSSSSMLHMDTLPLITVLVRQP